MMNEADIGKKFQKAVQENKKAIAAYCDALDDLAAAWERGQYLTRNEAASRWRGREGEGGWRIMWKS